MSFGHPGEDLSAYLDGELDSLELVRVKGHISGCDHCRDEEPVECRQRTAGASGCGLASAFIAPPIGGWARVPLRCAPSAGR